MFYKSEKEREELRNKYGTSDDPTGGHTYIFKPSFEDIDHKVTLQILEDTRKKAMNAQLKCNVFPNQLIQDWYNEQSEILNSCKDFWFITINPNPKHDKDWEEILDSLFALKALKPYEEFYISMEQRACYPEPYRGIHFHMLLSKYNIEKARINKFFTERFKKYCSPEKKTNKKTGKTYEDWSSVINLKLKGRKYFQDKLDYISGKKTDDDKPEKCENDKRMWEEFQIQGFWDFDNIPTRKSKSSAGGARTGSGVKLGDKRGQYKKKKTPESKEKTQNLGGKLEKVTTLVTF